MQRTIKNSVHTSGIGLHTGCKVSVSLKPAPADTGVIFRRTDLQGFEIEAQRRWVSRVILATTLMKRGVMLSTVEHLLSAVYGCGLDNLYIEIDSLEVPILDGSALPWIELISGAGSQEQESEKLYLAIREPIRLEDKDKFISIEPYPAFRVSYDIDFDHPAIGQQSFDAEISPAVYMREIAYARTFGFYHEIEDLLKKGLIRGGSFENAVVLGESEVMNTELREKDEFVRHKVLDLIGDISLCGFPLVGRIKAFRAGHALHTNLATEISREEGSTEKVSESELVEMIQAVNQ
jgi:UDP-3-O-[3-hydroxymyristoyl] N-acetylglucosamine deacetylase